MRAEALTRIGLHADEIVMPRRLEKYILGVVTGAVTEMFKFPNDMLPVPVEANHLNDQILVRYYECDWKDIAH